jgi:pyruvate ferredoxin oxidoreductase gamma subunit
MASMIEIRFHGRGGQGAVTSAELLAHAAIGEGKYAQAFPSFGPERRGAPVLAFARISEKPIYKREQVYEPNVVIVLDSGLLTIVNVEDGMREGGVLIVNTKQSLEEFKGKHSFSHRLCLVDATGIALEILKRPITNTTMLGAMVRATGAIDLTSMKAPLEERFGKIASRNYAVMQAAFDKAILEG